MQCAKAIKLDSFKELQENNRSLPENRKSIKWKTPWFTDKRMIKAFAFNLQRITST